jgi:hypothetical protein
MGRRERKSNGEANGNGIFARDSIRITRLQQKLRTEP